MTNPIAVSQQRRRILARQIYAWAQSTSSSAKEAEDFACAAIDAFEAEIRADEREMLTARKGFPILGERGAKVDWQLVADHGKQAHANHYQTVERLAERGGLSWCELHAVLHNRKWQKMDQNEAMLGCRAMEARYLDAIRNQKDHDHD
ncbi:hypothetical protein OSJ57_26040 [Sphingomonas sp. HH69]